MKLNRIGILTGGGDCPGLNAVIRSIAKPAMSHFNLIPDFIFQELTPEGFIDASIEILRSKSRPSAIITYGAEYESVILAAAKLGIRIPEELSVISFVSKYTVFAGIEVSSMTIPFMQVGEESAGMLMAKISGRNEKMKSIPVSYSSPSGRTCAEPA